MICRRRLEETAKAEQRQRAGATLDPPSRARWWVGSSRALCAAPNSRSTRPPSIEWGINQSIHAHTAHARSARCPRPLRHTLPLPYHGTAEPKPALGDSIIALDPWKLGDGRCRDVGKPPTCDGPPLCLPPSSSAVTRRHRAGSRNTSQTAPPGPRPRASTSALRWHRHARCSSRTWCCPAEPRAPCVSLGRIGHGGHRPCFALPARCPVQGARPCKRVPRAFRQNPSPSIFDKRLPGFPPNVADDHVGH